MRVGGESFSLQLGLLPHNTGGQHPVGSMLPIPRGMRLNACATWTRRLPWGEEAFPGSCLLSLAAGGVLFSHVALDETHQLGEIVA